MAEHNDFGFWGECVAAEYLENLGYVIMARDWKYMHKDLDVVCYDNKTETLIIVEVKTRTEENLTTALQAVTPEKERNMFSAAFAYARTIGHYFPRIRFDIITIVGSPEDYSITHYDDVLHPGNKGKRLF